MAKKISYNQKTHEELAAELTKLRANLRDESVKMMQNRSIKEYRLTRKNIARVLTAMNDSTKV